MKNTKVVKNTDFRELLTKELKDPEFKKEWDRLEPAYQTAKSTDKS